MGTPKNIFEIYIQLGHTPSKTFASLGLSFWMH